MNNMMWLIRAVRWVRNPPSAGRVWLLILVVTAVILLGAIDWMGWWPEWAQVEPRRPRLPRP